MDKSSKTFRYGCRIVIYLLAAVMLIPLVLLVSVSFTDNQAILDTGYRLIPKRFSLEAYAYIWAKVDQIAHSVVVSFAITIIGTVLGVTITLLFAYPISRRDYPLRKMMTFFILIPMLFNAGIVPTYIMYTQVIPIKNTYLALLIPNLLLNVFNVIVCRTFFITGIPMEVIEAAKIDGAGETRIFLRIVLPMSTSIIGTVSLMTGMGYWNDWINGLYYITKPEYYSLQNLLNRMMTDIQFLQTGSNSMMQGLNEMIANLPQASVRMALAVVGILPVLVIFPFVNRFFAKGVAMGAIKG